MDQDFHYYGTYYAARHGGFEKNQAGLIAKAANFIDFFSESGYAAYWHLVSDTRKSEKYDVIAEMNYPRYTYQNGNLSVGLAPEDGLWCSYHFTPGNYPEPQGTPSRESVHGSALASLLPAFITRDATAGSKILMSEGHYSLEQRLDAKNDIKLGRMLNRPQSSLSRHLILDAITCARDDNRLRAILRCALAGQHILAHDAESCLARFKLILLGIRAHVIADTWAHQDFCGLDSVLNTYWDVDYDPSSWNPSKWGYGRQSIDFYDGSKKGWQNTVLSSWRSGNFEAVPSKTSYLGHGWMGHFPDFSFAQFRYKPCWADPAKGPVLRNNPEQYKMAWLELVSLFSQASGGGQIKPNPHFEAGLEKAAAAISSPCNLSGQVLGRQSSAEAWLKTFGDAPTQLINVQSEPDPAATMAGLIQETKNMTRFGINYVNACSDLYLFQVAADYHFHFVRNYLEHFGIYQFTGAWSNQRSALDPTAVKGLFSW